MNFGQTSLAWMLRICFLCSMVVKDESATQMELIKMALNIHKADETMLPLSFPFCNWAMITDMGKITGKGSLVCHLPYDVFSLVINKSACIVTCKGPSLVLCNRFAKNNMLLIVIMSNLDLSYVPTCSLKLGNKRLPFVTTFFTL